MYVVCPIIIDELNKDFRKISIRRYRLPKSFRIDRFAVAYVAEIERNRLKLAGLFKLRDCFVTVSLTLNFSRGRFYVVFLVQTISHNDCFIDIFKREIWCA